MRHDANVEWQAGRSESRQPARGSASRVTSRRPLAVWTAVVVVGVSGAAASLWNACSFIASATIVVATNPDRVTGGGETSAEAIEDLRRAILSEENVERAGTEAGIILADGRKSEFVQRVRSATRIDVATVDESQEVITIAIHGRSQSRVSALAAALARNCATDGETAGAALQPRMEPNATATRFNVRLALAGLVATFGLSLFAGVASAALARWRDTTFHSLAEARAHFQIPVLGAVPLTGPAASDS